MEELKNKYYIRLNENGRIIKTFSSAFEKSLESDIVVGEDYGSQFRADAGVLSEELQSFASVENGLMLMNDLGGYQLKYENGLICKVSEDDEEFVLLARTNKKVELTRSCNKAILSGFETEEGKFYQFDEKDQSNFTQQTMMLIMDSSITTVLWESGDKDGKFTEYTKEEFLQLIGLAQLHKNTKISKLTTLRSQLDSAKTIEEIKSIEW